MTTRIRSESNAHYSFSLRAVGDDHTPAEPDFACHKYSMKQDESLNADIREDTVYSEEVFSWVPNGHGGTVLSRKIRQEPRSTIAWSAYGFSDTSSAWGSVINKGISIGDQLTMLDAKLVKKVAGEMIDPTMYLKEIDSNFGMAVRRMTQAWEFIRNLRNPQKLARLTMRYFRGQETRRSLVRRYRKARSTFNLRSRHWRTRDWSSAYLEYQFGWRPLIEDTANLVKLAKNTAVRLRTHRVTVGLASETRKYDMVGGPISSTDKNINRVYVEDKTGGHARLSFSIDNSAIRSLASMALPVYSAWDAIPFSFLADMATNVGDHLKYIGYHWGLSLQKGQNYRVAYRNLYAKMEINPCDIWSPKQGVFPNTRTNYIQKGSIFRRTIQTERQIIKDWPNLPWIDKTPKILDNTGQIITIGALVHQWIADATSHRLWNEVL